MSNPDISTIEVYMARKHSAVIPKERFRPAQAAAAALNQNCRCAGKFVRCCAVPEIKLTENLNLFDLIFQVLRCQGVDRSKLMYFKASDLCLVITT
jgi:hypothetical protein